MDRDAARRIFGEATEQAPEERDRFVREQCAGDQELIAEILDLLGALSSAGSYLACDRSNGEPANAAVFPGAADPDLSGTRVGPYKLLERIGQGGFGVVYLAEQERPVRRTVAVKIIREGLGTHQVLARFEVERRALAMMNHPNIAHVLDAGATGTGQPYFVMELVRGVPITEYCDQACLEPRGRLELMISVCQAVQHAHQKGIIHRDIKPSNVLVTVRDEVAVPKVIDFGVAKSTADRLTDRTLFTEFRAVIGTPAYMSPEQAQLGGTDIDTRSDVYSLGVLMYELLTGSTPFETTRLLKASLGEIQNILLNEEPPRPSTRLSRLGSSLAAVARARRMEPRRLGGMVRGELDWIVMKAMEKDRRRRYDSAAALAADIRRHLNHEPLEVGPPSLRYRFMKFVRRNRTLAAASAAVLAALVIGLAVAATGFFAARQQRDRAIEAEGKQRELASSLEERSHRLALSAATLATEAGDGIAARAALDSVPVLRRGWEWGLLEGRAFRSLRDIQTLAPIENLVLHDVTPLALGVPESSERWVVYDLGDGSVVREFQTAEASLLPCESDVLIRCPDGAIARVGTVSGQEIWRTIPLAPTNARTRLDPSRASLLGGGEWAIWQPGVDGKGEAVIFSSTNGRRLRSVKPAMGVSLAPAYMRLSNGRSCLSAGELFDAATDEVLRAPARWSGRSAVAYDRVIAVSAHNASIIDTVLNREVAIPYGVGGGASWIDVSPEWVRAATVDGRGAVCLWDARSSPPRPYGAPMASSTPMTRVAWKMDGEMIVGWNAKQISVWSPAAFPVTPQATLMDIRTAHVIVPDAARLYGAGWGDVLAMDAETCLPRWRRNLGRGWGMGWRTRSAAGTIAVAFARDREDGTPQDELFLVRAETGEPLASFSPDAVTPDPLRAGASPPWTGRVRSLAFVREGERLVVGLDDRRTIAFDVASWQPFVEATHSVRPVCMAASPDGALLAIGAGSQGREDLLNIRRNERDESRLVVLDAETLSPAWSLNLGEPVGGIQWSHDGRRIAAMVGPRRVALIDVASRDAAWIAELPSGTVCRCLAITPDGSRLVVLGASVIVVYDARNGNLLVQRTNAPRRCAGWARKSWSVICSISMRCIGRSPAARRCTSACRSRIPTWPRRSTPPLWPSITG